MTIQLTDDQRIKLLNSDDVYSVMQEILLREEKIDQDKEHFWICGLAMNNRLLFVELVSLGSVRATSVEPINVFRVAVMKNAVNVILIHNHPSGELQPSDQDKDLTDRLIQVGRILNIKVLDHLIISTKSYVSFDDLKLMAELEQSTKWIPQFELIERIREQEKMIREEALRQEREKSLKEGEEKGKIIGKEEGKHLEKLEIARKSLKMGLSIEAIIEITGLRREEIEKLNF